MTECEQLLYLTLSVQLEVILLYFVMCNLYMSAQLVRLALEVVQNDGDFMQVILVYTFAHAASCATEVELCHVFTSSA
jgi:hypothetical protein